MEEARIRVFVEGRVQGVCFRDATRRQALELGVCGWVRNRRDGRVEVVAEGNRDALDRLELFLHSGPPGANVTNLEVANEPYGAEFRDFRINPSV